MIHAEARLRASRDSARHHSEECPFLSILNPLIHHEDTHSIHRLRRGSAARSRCAIQLVRQFHVRQFIQRLGPLVVVFLQLSIVEFLFAAGFEFVVDVVPFR
jgi:hypothetical protein